MNNKCPHCSTVIKKYYEFLPLIESDADFWQWQLLHYLCPECGRIVIELQYYEVHRTESSESRAERPTIIQVYPKGTARKPVPPEVPEDFTKDYKEACLVLADSPKASAALSRRCLQHLLREKVGIKPSNLSKEIQDVIDNEALPSYLADDIDAVRNIGNFAAHPIKSKNTGEVLPVELGEAEWNLDVIESLFDFYFVLPAQARKKRETLNRKLEEAGKPEMKRPE